MASVEVGDINIEYEVTGAGEPLLLIMGLGGQLTDWPQDFVTALAQHFTVYRFDNRDSGLTTHIDAPLPSRWQFIAASLWPGRATPAYTLRQMADDAAGLLDALDIERAHVVGMSMGGMIAQLVAIHHPERVGSLCSIMSNTGNRRHGRPTARVLRALAQRREPNEAAAVQTTMDFFTLVGGPDWDFEEQRVRTTASVARSYNPRGVLRQSYAIAAAPDRTTSLRDVAVQSLVIHGLDDPLVRPSGGLATARALPESRLLMFPRMGHDIPATRHAEIVEAIRDNAGCD